MPDFSVPSDMDMNDFIIFGNQVIIFILYIISIIFGFIKLITFKGILFIGRIN